MFLKKFFIIGAMVLWILGMPFCARAEELEAYVVDEGKPYDYKLWERNGRFEQKVYEVGFRLLNANKFPRNVGFYVMKTHTAHPNAYARYLDGSIVILESYKYYFDSDDELASVLAHEMGHFQQLSTGFWPWKRVKMLLAPKYYEYDADLKGIDYMVKAGYNPLAMISADNKIMGEHSFLAKFLLFGGSFKRFMGYLVFIPEDTHPTASKRLAKMYSHILVNYPNFITEGYENPYYANFLMNAEKDKNIQEIKNRHDL